MLVLFFSECCLVIGNELCHLEWEDGVDTYRRADNSCVMWTVSLKPELFEGLRFDFTKPLNQRFSLSHRYGGSLVQLFISHLVYSLMEVSSATIGDWLLPGMLVHYVVMVGLSFLLHPFCKLVVLCSNG
jgi:hypothetical protein